MWGRWYLPMFLFRDGSLTLMNRASLIAPVRFWSFLPTMVKSLMLILWPEVLQWSNIGEGAFWCSLNLSAKVPADSPIYSSSHPCSLHLYLYMAPLLLVIGSLSLGTIRRLLMVCPLKWPCTPNLLHVFFILSLKPSWHGTTMYKFCLLLFWAVWHNLAQHLPKQQHQTSICDNNTSHKKPMAITSAQHVNSLRHDIKHVVITSIPLNNTGFNIWPGGTTSTTKS